MENIKKMEIFGDLGGFWADFKDFKWIFGIQNSSLKAFELFQTKVTIRDTKYFFWIYWDF
jgi:hypothetical protein